MTIRVTIPDQDDITPPEVIRYESQVSLAYNCWTVSLIVHSSVNSVRLDFDLPADALQGYDWEEEDPNRERLLEDSRLKTLEPLFVLDYSEGVEALPRITRGMREFYADFWVPAGIGQEERIFLAELFCLMNFENGDIRG